MINVCDFSDEFVQETLAIPSLLENGHNVCRKNKALYRRGIWGEKPDAIQDIFACPKFQTRRVIDEVTAPTPVVLHSQNTENDRS